MTNASKKPGGWSNVRQQITSLEKPALLALVKDLYESASMNRDFIHARFVDGEDASEALEKYRGKIVEQFYPLRGEPKLKYGEARKAIREYRKATGNLLGTMDLMMTYVENGASFTHDYGDIDERFYDSIESMLVELDTLLRGKGQEYYLQFSERLEKVAEMSSRVGWGFGDFVSDIVFQLYTDLGDDEDEE
jgi:hypothetical protein